MPLDLMNAILLLICTARSHDRSRYVSKRIANYSNDTMYEYKPKTILA
jgi:hypothetical protein